MRHIFTFIVSLAAIWPVIGQTGIIGQPIKPLSTASSGSTLLSNLVAYWTLDEASGTRFDSTASDQDLAPTNNVNSGTGLISNAIVMPNPVTSADWLWIADNSTMSVGDIDFTFTTWIWFTNLPSALGADATFLKKDEVAGVRDYRLEVLGNFPFDQARWTKWAPATDTPASVTASSFGALSAATWYWICVWHDAGNNEIGISINNSATNVTSTSTGVADTAAGFRLGMDLMGRQDETGFWKRLLTADEKATNYNGGLGKTYPFTP